jgi:3-phenylpropionate/trans-cinnamate dioxygenase ferredoxin subunit
VELLESGYITAAEKSEIPTGKMKKVTLQGKAILVANVNGNYYAIEAKCTHMGGDLSQGSLQDSVVTCPKQGAKFDVMTDRVISRPKVAFFHPKMKDDPSYAVKVENENILIKI